jgi:hypothetical protein
MCSILKLQCSMGSKFFVDNIFNLESFRVLNMRYKIKKSEVKRNAYVRYVRCAS